MKSQREIDVEMCGHELTVYGNNSKKVCMCQQHLHRIEALQDTVATLYKELEYRQAIIGELQTENNTLRRRIMDVIENYSTEAAA